MNIWNKELELHSLPLSVRDSFLGHYAEKRLFSAGSNLVRIVTIGNNSFSGAFCITPSFYDHIKAYANSRQIALPVAVRESLSVLSKFSPNLNVAVSIILGNNMFGFVGQASSQLDIEKGQYFSGGCEQIFIPNLSKEHSNRLSLLERI